ncbi:hypothetical protein B7P43_G14630, partial [Cryptotermes secundus]
KISLSPRYKKSWQRKLSKKYPQTKQKEDLGLTSSNRFFSDTVQRIQRPENGPEIADVRTDQRIKKGLSPDTYSFKAQKNSPNHHRITYKEESNSRNSWKPIRGHKIVNSFKSRYKTTTSNPLSPGEETSAYKDKRQNSEEEEDPYGNKHMFGDDSGDSDEDYDDIDDYTSKIQKALKSDGSNIGLQEMYQQKDDSVQRYLDHVPYPAKIKDDTRETSAYKDKRQYSEEEEDPYGNKHMFGDDSGDSDEDYDDIDDYTSKIQKALKSDGSNIGLQEMYQQKDDSVQRYLDHVPYPAKIKDDTRRYEHGSSYRSSENETEDNERTQNIIHSRIDHLKEMTKRGMANNFYSEQNSRAPTHGKIANDRIKWVKF